MYYFDLIYSEDLGLQHYSDRDLHCCLNIFKRPISCLNKKNDYKLKDVVIKENRRTTKTTKPQVDASLYDVGICSYGSGIIGKTPKYVGQYVKEFYFKINNDMFREKIVRLIETTDWEHDVCNGISGQTNLSQWQVYKYLKEQIPELE